MPEDPRPAQPVSIAQARVVARRRSWRRAPKWLVLSFWGVYVVGVVATQVWFQPEVDRRWAARRADGMTVVQVPHRAPDGTALDASRDQAFVDFAPASGADGKPPVIMMHGSPGGASNFGTHPPLQPSGLGAEVAARGRRAIAPDLAGFGGSPDPDFPLGDYSMRTQAHAIVDLMDALEIPRAHLLAWSNSGGIAIRLADRHPERIASITLLAATGPQNTEGSGSYLFEHAKYALGYLASAVAPEVIPHMGLFGPREARHAWIRNFWDSDQRPMAEIMRRLETPTLIYHGRYDWLVADWAAERHNELIATSRLVMVDGQHFMPFTAPAQTADDVEAHFARHDAPGADPLLDDDIREPRRQRTGLLGVYDALGEVMRWMPWWALIIPVSLLAWRWPEGAVVLAAFAVGQRDLDFGVAFAGLVVGRLITGPTVFDRGRRPGWLASMALWVLIAEFIAWLLNSHATGVQTIEWATEAAGPVGFIASVSVLAVVLRLARSLPMVLTTLGRARIASTWARAWRLEYWPTWLLYVLIFPTLLKGTIRSRHPLAFTACNPAIPSGGGLLGESKAHIMRVFGDEAALLPMGIVEARGTPEQRAERAVAMLEARPELGGLPAILKPDVGQRGMGVRLARSPEDVRSHFADAEGEDVVIQKYHPGPEECGLFWMRYSPSSPRRADADRAGYIFAITRKSLPIVVGDGVHTLEELIMRHPRCRCQADVFIDRLEGRRDDVPARGEHVRIGEAGNHAQGALFTDGADLITPELEDVIDAIARKIGDGGFDFGRFDLRYSGEGELKRGRGFAIIEVNGVSAEATNLYDPRRSWWWAVSVLAGQWKRAYELGAERMRAGQRPIALWRVAWLVLRYLVFRERRVAR